MVTVDCWRPRVYMKSPTNIYLTKAIRELLPVRFCNEVLHHQWVFGPGALLASCQNMAVELCWHPAKIWLLSVTKIEVEL